MTPAELVRRGADYLERHDVASPRVTAELLLASAMDTDRSGLYSRSEGVTAAQTKAFGRALCRRCTGTPTQHLTGLEGFRRLTLVVRPGVFIPRPESEGIVDLLLEALEGSTAPTVVDVGTGSGAIALAIVDERPDAQVFAIDRSSAAVTLADENAARLGMPVEVLLGDLLEPLPVAVRGILDAVVSNPPYIRPDEVAALPPEVRADPLGALVGKLDVIERLFEEALAWLRPGGVVIVEIGETQGQEVLGAATAAGLVDPCLHPDLTGRDRFVVARAP